MATAARETLAGVGVLLGPPGPSGGAWDVLTAAVAAAEVAVRAGCSSLWVAEPTAEPPGRVPYEAFSLLGALATRTDGIHLGVAADGAQRRAPSILAKIVTGVDVISHGRAVLSLDGDGGHDGDAARLAEALAVSRAVLEDEDPVVDGRIYHVAGAVNRPAPVQAGGVPLVVFVNGSGPGRAGLLDVCARSADAVVVDGGPDGVAAARDRLGSAGEGGRSHTLLLGRIPAGAPAGECAARLRDAGADGCLVTLAAPWRTADVEGADLTW